MQAVPSQPLSHHALLKVCLYLYVIFALHLHARLTMTLRDVNLEITVGMDEEKEDPTYPLLQNRGDVHPPQGWTWLRIRKEVYRRGRSLLRLPIILGALALVAASLILVVVFWVSQSSTHITAVTTSRERQPTTSPFKRPTATPSPYTDLPLKTNKYLESLSSSISTTRPLGFGTSKIYQGNSIPAMPTFGGTATELSNMGLFRGRTRMGGRGV